MRDNYTELRTHYYDTLQGSVTLGGADVNVYDVVEADADTPYIYFGEFDAAEDSSKDGYITNVTIGLLIVTKYTNAVGGSKDSDDIASQILQLINNKTVVSTNNFKVILSKLVSNFTNKTPTKTGTTIKKTLRIEHVVQQIGGDLERITDLTATTDGATEIDLAWSNVVGNTGYRVERSLDLESGFTLLTTLSTDVVVYSDTGLTTDTVYYYRIRAFNTAGGSGWSNISADKVVAPGISQSGITYDRDELTGQTVSYRTGDFGYHLALGTYDYIQPTYPVSYAKLDTADANPFDTLLFNNAFGNKNRFTDDSGGQTYANDYVIDHLTGLGWYRVLQSNALWNDGIDTADAITLLTFSDWRLPHANEQWNIYNKSNAAALNYSPFNIISGANFLTSSTNASDTLRYNTVFPSNGGFITRQIKASTTGAYLLVRNHYT